MKSPKLSGMDRPRSSGGYGALRSSMEDYDPAPVMTYEQATAQAQRSYDKYRAKQKAFDEKYGGLEHPEQYYGYRQRSQELGRLQEECVKMVDLMRRHYREMDVEPLFTLSGPVEDPEPYQQQVSAMMSEMEDYIEASNGLPDPTALNQMQTNIVRLQAAIGDLPTEAPHEEVLLQVLGGNYYDNVTMGGTAAQIGLGLSGLDLPMDLRDLSYDLGHLRTTPWSQTAMDMLALLPVVGALKYTDEAVELAQAARRAGALAESADAADTARVGQRLSELGVNFVESARDGSRFMENGDEIAEITMRSGGRVFGNQDNILQEINSILGESVGPIQKLDWDESLGVDMWSPDVVKGMRNMEISRIPERFETATVYDLKGNVVLERTGNSSSVQFMENEVAQMTGGVLTHNHPNSSCFSPEDINMLRYGRLSEIRASTLQGVFRMQQPKIWNEEIGNLDRIREVYYRIDTEVSMPIYNQARMGMISFEHAETLSEIATVSLFCERHGIPFVFELSK